MCWSMTDIIPQESTRSEDKVTRIVPDKIGGKFEANANSRPEEVTPKAEASRLNSKQLIIGTV